MIRIRPHPPLLERNIVWQFLPLCFYMFTKRKIFLYLKLWFKTLIHCDLSQATDWNHVYGSIIIHFFIFQIEHNCILIGESKGLKLQNKIYFCGGKCKCLFFHKYMAAIVFSMKYNKCVCLFHFDSSETNGSKQLS